jgi:hypothetical protein
MIFSQDAAIFPLFHNYQMRKKLLRGIRQLAAFPIQQTHEKRQFQKDITLWIYNSMFVAI